jgi:hypothetical protein
MSKKTITELEILSHAYAKNPTPENAAELIKTLQLALSSTQKEKSELEKGIRTLELFLSEKTDCERKKP